jgi:opacity protein-like surface antigen
VPLCRGHHREAHRSGDEGVWWKAGVVVRHGRATSIPPPIFNEQLSASEIRPGWTVGGGVEWVFWNNWSAKIEYDFYDFGTRNVTLTGTFAGVQLLLQVSTSSRQSRPSSSGSITGLDGRNGILI